MIYVKNIKLRPKVFKVCVLATILVFLLISKQALAQTTGTLKWEFLTGSLVASSPSIGADGTVYVGSFDNKLYAINPDGTKKWEFLTGGLINSSPSIGTDGTIYVGSNDKRLYAINPDGTEKWKFAIGTLGLSTSITIGTDGTIYSGSAYSLDKFYAINPDGTLKWEFKAVDDITPPAIGADGTIYFGTFNSSGGNVGNNRFYAINPDGTKRWEFLTGDSVINSPPAIGGDGTIYFGTIEYSIFPNRKHKLNAINPNGTKRWEFQAGVFHPYSSPSIGTDGTIYVCSDNNKLYAVNPDGTKKWEFLAGNAVFSSPSIGADGTIYVGSFDNKLYAINPDGTKKWEFLTGNAVFSSPTIGGDGTIYVGSYDNKLYAIYSDSGGLADSPWPMFQHDVKHTGNVTVAESCNYSISPTNKSFDSIGGAGSVSVSDPGSCGWTATSNAPWITITSGGSGSGNGTISYSVSANTGSSRTGTITIASKTFTVTQDGDPIGPGSCPESISPVSKSFGPGGGTDSVAVVASGSCGWMAISNDPSWINVASPIGIVTGDGTVSYSVLPNTSTSPRTGTITIEGERILVFSITQSGVGASPAPDIKAISSDGTITSGTSDILSINVSLAAGSSMGVDSDWWVATDAPFGWFYFDVGTMNWTYAGSSYTDLSPTYQGPLFDLTPPFEVLNMSGLPVGTYTFYFAVDTNRNGSLDLDQLYYDSVVVNITP